MTGAAITPIDIERAYFYANTCTKQYEKAKSYGYDLEDWEFFEFSYHYCKQILGDRYYEVVANVMSDHTK